MGLLEGERKKTLTIVVPLFEILWKFGWALLNGRAGLEFGQAEWGQQLLGALVPPVQAGQVKRGVALDVADTGLGPGDQQPAHDASLLGQYGQVQRRLADVVLDVEPGAGRATDQLGRDLDVLVDDGQMEVPVGEGKTTRR